MLKRLLFALCLIAAPVFAQEAPPQDRIVAKVNTDIITSGDVWARYRMIQRSSSLPDNPDIRKEAFPQVLNTLIEEKLQLQAARRYGLKIADQDIDNGLAEVAKNNGAPSKEAFEEALRKKGVSIDEVRRQMRGQIAWSAFVQRALRPSVSVSESEVDKLQAEMEAKRGQKEYQIAEIQLPASSQQQAQESEALAKRLSLEMRKGARFRDIASEFSKASSAANGGLLGWVNPGDLPPEVEKVVASTPPETLSPPIVTKEGVWLILKLAERVGQGAPERGEIKTRIGTRKLERAAQTYLNDLRDEALIEFPSHSGA